jgi:hypothetical protein
MTLVNQLSFDAAAAGLFLAASLLWAMRTRRLRREQLPVVLGGGVLVYGFVLLSLGTLAFRPPGEWAHDLFVDLFVACCTGLAAYWSGRAL